MASKKVGGARVAEPDAQTFTVVLEDLRTQFGVFGEALQELREDIDTRFDAVDRRFDGMDQRFAGIDQQVGLVKTAVLENSRELKEHGRLLKEHGNELKQLRQASEGVGRRLAVSTRIVLGIGAVQLLVACSAGSTGAGSSGTSTTSREPAGTLTFCSSNATTSTCTQAELQAYDACFLSKCESTLIACVGSAYKSGTFSGPCGTYLTCANACDCADAPCLQKCSGEGACNDCLANNVHSCVQAQGCTLPAC